MRTADNQLRCLGCISYVSFIWTYCLRRRHHCHGKIKIEICAAMSTFTAPTRNNEGREVDRNGFYLSADQLEHGLDASGVPLVLEGQALKQMRYEFLAIFCVSKICPYRNNLPEKMCIQFGWSNCCVLFLLDVAVEKTNGVRWLGIGTFGWANTTWQ